MNILKRYLSHFWRSLIHAWLNWDLRSIAVRLAAQRDEVAYLTAEYEASPLDSYLQYELIEARDYVHALEQERDRIEAEIRELLIKA